MREPRALDGWTEPRGSYTQTLSLSRAHIDLRQREPTYNGIVGGAGRGTSAQRRTAAAN